MIPQWKIEYPENAMRYIDAFRRDIYDYDEVARAMDGFFRRAGGVRTVCELGAGTGTNMLRLARLGDYVCSGIDSNGESVALAESRSREQGARARFAHMNFFEELPREVYDAVVVLFVPLAVRDMSSLALRAAACVRPGGYFASMMLSVLPELADTPRAHEESIEQLELDGEQVVRMNFFRKEGRQVHFDGIYLVGDGERARMFRDRDTYDLILGDQKLAVPPDVLRHVERIRIQGNPTQPPPFTHEVLDFYQRV